MGTAILEIGDQQKRCAGEAIEAHQANAADFDQTRYRRRRRGEEVAFFRLAQNLIIGHQHRAAIDQAQRQIRLSGAGGPAQQHALARQRNACRVEEMHVADKVKRRRRAVNPCSGKPKYPPFIVR